jgi:K+-sensing histidine kinase KdpD
MTPPDSATGKDKLTSDDNIDKSELVSDLSHELRTLLGGVIGINELLLTTELSPHQRQLSQTIEQSSKALLMVLNEVVDFSRLALNKISLETVPVDLKKMISEILPQIDYLLQEKSTQLNIDCESVPSLVVTDAGKVSQILIILLLRMIKTSADGLVSMNVSTQKHSDQRTELQISVSAGVGEYDHLYLSTLNQPIKSGRKHDSRWLSLYLCHKLVLMMDGGCSAQFEDNHCQLSVRIPVTVPAVPT